MRERPDAHGAGRLPCGCGLAGRRRDGIQIGGCAATNRFGSPFDLRAAAASAPWYTPADVVLVNLKCAISAVYHALRQNKYARRYLAEAA